MCIFWIAFIFLFILLLIFATPVMGGIIIFIIMFMYVNRRTVFPE